MLNVPKIANSLNYVPEEAVHETHDATPFHISALVVVPDHFHTAWTILDDGTHILS